MFLYVMSRPHSGSTILDILLGNTGAVAGVGQLVSDMGKPDNPCACGATIRDCLFWREVRARVEAEGVAWAEAVALSVGQAHVGRFWRTLRAASDDPGMLRLAAVTAAVERAVAGASGRPHVLDSSKEPTRALFLARLGHAMVRARRGGGGGGRCCSWTSTASRTSTTPWGTPRATCCWSRRQGASATA